MRKNLLEIIKEFDINPQEEILKIENLFAIKRVSGSSTIENIIDKHYFLKWKYRNTCLSINEFRIKANLPIPDNKSTYANIDVKKMLTYFEFVFNMLFLINLQNHRHLEDRMCTIARNIHFILDKFNYKMHSTEDGFHLIVKKSEEIAAVAENYPDIAEEIIEYNRFSLNGNLKRKRELLSTLANKFEAIRDKLKANCQSDLTKDIGTILNGLNIRHNNQNSDFVKSLSNEELEKWYDRAYDTIILALMQNKYLAYKNEIKDLRIAIKPNKNDAKIL